MKTVRCFAVVLSAVALSPAWAQGLSRTSGVDSPAAYGAAVPEAQAVRTIRIGSDTRWVNVRRLETVRFVIEKDGAQKAFAWRFDERPPRLFDLKDIAPEGALPPQKITVYVARNPAFDGGR